ncbi:hypothetical protein [Clostridium sp. UBA6640]|uniref:hypothetical protein n=1 Tax=Clostridium sp. UBA6640 TaxID=1946370 RepID=UPI0025BF0AB3|nr:hypothetical protein [Clostridium sp. UBA6640]
MAYVKTYWKNRIVERPKTFRQQENADGTVTLIPEEGQIIEPGTPVKAESMNNIENGIEALESQMAEIMTKMGYYDDFGIVKDTRRIWTERQWKRKDGTLYMRSNLTNPDANGNYRTMIWKIYKENGTTVDKTVICILTYDAEQDIKQKKFVIS